MTATSPRLHWKRVTDVYRIAAHCLAASACVSLLLAVPFARAGVPAGEIVALDGTAEILRNDDKIPAALGAVVEIGDTVRTHNPGRVRLLFTDGSTLVVGDASNLLINEYVFDPAGGKSRTLLKLFQGKVRALVSEYYGDGSASYEIETPGAVAGVRGTDFLVDHDTEHGTSDIATLRGRVTVRSSADPTAEGVTVAADQITEVKNGRPPAKPRALSSAEKIRYLEVLQLSGVGELGAALEQDPVLAGEEVPNSERPSTGGPGTGASPGVGEDPGGRPSTPSDPIGQPIPALEGPGQVGVPF